MKFFRKIGRFVGNTFDKFVGKDVYIKPGDITWGLSPPKNYDDVSDMLGYDASKDWRLDKDTLFVDGIPVEHGHELGILDALGVTETPTPFSSGGSLSTNTNSANTSTAPPTISGNTKTLLLVGSGIIFLYLIFK